MCLTNLEIGVIIKSQKGKENPKHQKGTTMTEMMMKKVAEAKAMVTYFVEHKLIGDGADVFYPAQYEEMRYQWDKATPTWATLKKYAEEIGLVAEVKEEEWFSDGSPMGVLGALYGMEGQKFTYTVYRFA